MCRLPYPFFFAAWLGMVCLSTFPLTARSVNTTATPPVDTTEGQGPKPAKGWFFYEVTPPPVTPPKKPKPLPRSDGDSTMTKPPAVGSAAWMRKTWPRIRDRAIDHPTEKNVELAAYLHKYMMDKSQRFATAWVRTNASVPGLANNAGNPTSSFARSTDAAIRDKAETAALKAVGKNTVIWYFFRSDCPYCAKETPILNLLTREYGVKVLPISTDGKPLDGGGYSGAWVADSGQAAYLNVTVTPTLYVVHPPKGVALLSVGLRSYPEMKTRLLDTTHQAQWLSDDLYARAVEGSPMASLVDGFDPSRVETSDDPNMLLQAFRAAGTHSRRATTLDDVNAGTKARDSKQPGDAP